MHIRIELRGDQVGQFAAQARAAGRLHLSGLTPLGSAQERYALCVTDNTIALEDGTGASLVPPVQAPATAKPGMDWLILPGTQYLIDLSGVVPGEAVYDYMELAAPRDLPWIAEETLIDTVRGPVAAGDLRPGDRVLTRDQGAQPVLWCARIEARLEGVAIAAQSFPKRGAKAPLVLSPAQHVLFGGMRSTDFPNRSEVLVRAEALSALPGSTEATVTAGVLLLLPRHSLMMADGAAFESLYPEADTLARLAPEAVDEIVQHLPELRYAHEAEAYPPARPRLDLNASRAFAALLAQRGGQFTLKTARGDTEGRITSYTNATVIHTSRLH